MNYSELSTAIQDYCENAEVSFLKQINNFIVFTEDKIFSSVTSPIYWKTSSSISFNNSTDTYETPAGVLDILHISISETPGDADGPMRYLLRKDYSFLYEAFPGSAAGRDGGIPKYYAVSSAQKNTSDPSNPSMNIKIAPRPTSGNVYSAFIDYYGKSTTDSITNGVTIDSSTGAASGSTSNTTWISIAFPEVLLYGCLVHAYTYMKGEPSLLADYNDKFNQGLMLMKNLSESRENTDTFSDLGKPSSGV